MDDSIKRALENLRADDSVNHWDGMESLLNEAANADLSELAEDQVLRNKLGDLVPEMPTGHWALMEAQLAGMDVDAEEELEDMMLDGKAYESLNGLTAPYNDQHWPIMEDKLVDAFSWRKRAVRYKIAELAILLLAFVTILQYWPEAKEILPKIKKKVQNITTPMAATTPSAAAELEPKAELEKNISEINLSSTNTSIEITGDNPSQSIVTQDEFIQNDFIVESLTTTSKSKGSLAKLPISNNNKELKAPAEIADLEFLTTERSKKIQAVPTIPHLTFGQLATKELELSNGKLQLAKLLGNTSFRMGMYGMSSFDALEKPSLPENSLTRISETESATIGYGTGLSMAFKNGRWELESGIGYLSKSVRPDNPNIKEADVSLKRGEVAVNHWKETQYDMINIPVHVRFDMLHRPKWKMYLQSGMSLNINQNIIYRYDEVYFGSGPENNLLAPSEQGNRDFLDPRDVTKDVVEENLSATNTFFNFDVGFGLERAINQRYATFFQTRYSHRLGEAGGLGIEDESAIFRSVQLKAGLKVSLFNKR